MAHIMLIRMRRKSTSFVKDLPSNCNIVWFSPPNCPTMNWRVALLIKRGQWRPLLRPRRRREKGWCLGPLLVVVLAVLLLNTAWCIPHLGVSCADLNSSSIKAVAHNTNSGSSNRNSSSSSLTVLLLHLRSRRPLGHPAASHQQLSLLQLWEDGALCSWMPPAQAKQLTTSFNARGQLGKERTEGSCTTNWPRQLHYRGWDPHGRRNARGYVLPQWTSYYHTVWLLSIAWFYKLHMCQEGNSIYGCYRSTICD
jgi:hypothetical protein